MVDYHHSTTLSSTKFFSMGADKFKGKNFLPSALKNLLLNSTHCRRKACKKHSIESIPRMTPTVIDTKKYMPIRMIMALALTIPPPMVFSKKTRDN